MQPVKTAVWLKGSWETGAERENRFSLLLVVARSTPSVGVSHHYSSRLPTPQTLLRRACVRGRPNKMEAGWAAGQKAGQSEDGVRR